MLSSEELERYARHIVMRDVGGPGQAKLNAARVLVIGAGGLGAPALMYLAAAGVGTLGVVDDDHVSLSNLQRQIIHATPDVGRLKVDSAADRIAALNPHVMLRLHNRRIDAANALDHVDVRYAGGPSGANSFHCETDGSFSKSEDAAVSIYVKPGAFITNSLFSDSKGAGINLAYSDDYVDLKATNTFNAIAGCSVTRPRAKTTGACTASPCP